MDDLPSEGSGVSPLSLFLAPSIDDESVWAAWAEALPPSRAMGFRVQAVQAGLVVVVVDSSPWPLNPNGSVHGGFIAAVADQAGGLVAISSLGSAALPATATLHAEFLRPAIPPLTFTCRTTKTGRSLVFVDIVVDNGIGKQCAKFAGIWSVNAAQPDRRRAVDS